METSDKVSWNLSQELIYEIALLIHRKNQSYLSGHINDAFFTLKAIKLTFIQSLKLEERNRLFDIERQIAAEPINIGNKPNGLYACLFELYNETIMDYLDKYGYLLKKQEDHTRIN